MSIDSAINSFISPAADFLSAIIFYAVPVTVGAETTPLPLIVAWLIVAGFFFTFYLRFISLRGFTHAIELVRGKHSVADSPGEVSHFHALATAISGTVGLGNIAGVAVAITVGGPGAAFWMVVAGFLGMSLKFAECTLGVKYREIHADGTVTGGAMYYLSRGLAELHPRLARPGRIMAALFALCCVGGALGGGNMFQVNQAYQQVVNVTGGPQTWLGQNAWAFGLLMAVLTGAVIIGGMKGIANVTGRLVPLMCGLYLLAGLVIIAVNYQHIPAALLQIVQTAFVPEAVAGGIIGAIVAGFRRAAFSNEAGFGSAAIAHSAVRTHEPITEGFVALLEPFIDTIIICTMTALVIVISGAYGTEGVSGVSLTSAAFATVLPWFPEVLAVVVMLFAYSTMISWSYYGNRAWCYLLGHQRQVDLAYKLLFCVFTVIGSTMTLDKVIDFSDSMMFAMSIFNIIGLYLLAPTIRRELQLYWAKIRGLK